ncbi:TPA: gamma-glutamylcyclotransferase [Legionella pneumophila]|nr:gamma-glutamylcyclotransferase [Legionella pneumophila]
MKRQNTIVRFFHFIFFIQLSYLCYAKNLITDKNLTKEFATLPKHCRPNINPTLPQFIIGYGSLMQEESKKEDSSMVGENFPIYVSGFQRGWIERGTPIGFSTIYLGVVPKKDSIINAVYFKLNDPSQIKNYDKRENTYCRIKVPRDDIQALSSINLPEGQFWIYTTSGKQLAAPSSDYPIVQSYVDIFLSGCFSLEEKYHLKNFARDCIKTTSNWSGHWVNDRIYPRTAFDNIPYVAKVDPLIAVELPQFFKLIKIE